MWADTLLALERGHLLRLALWGAASVLVGVLALLLVRVRRAPAPLLQHFAIQTAAWGAVELLICLWSRQGLAFRDYTGAQRLVNLLWLNTGLDVGYVAIGGMLVALAWRWGARLGGVGAGLGIMLQGAVLFLLDVRLIALIGPLR